MAFKSTRMNQVKSILKDLVAGEPIKKTSRIYKLSKNTIKKYFSIFKLSGLDIEQLEEMTDEAFHQLFYVKPSKSDGELDRGEDFSQRVLLILNELGRTGVTRELLYKEYVSSYPSGYSYSRFCRKLKEHRLINEATLRIEHKSGYRMMVDFVGTKAQWVAARMQPFPSSFRASSFSLPRMVT